MIWYDVMLYDVIYCTGLKLQQHACSPGSKISKQGADWEVAKGNPETCHHHLAISATIHELMTIYRYPKTVGTIYINLHPFSLGQWHIRCDDVTNYEKDEMTSGWTYRLQRFAVEEVHREISLGLWLFPAVSVSYVIIMGHDFDVLRSKFKKIFGDICLLLAKHRNSSAGQGFTKEKVESRVSKVEPDISLPHMIPNVIHIISYICTYTNIYTQ